MRLHSILLVLLGCLCGTINASTSSSANLPGSRSISSSSTDSEILPAAAGPTALCRNRIRRAFVAELTIEVISLGITFATVGSSIGCSIPELLTVIIYFLVMLNVLKLASMTTRTELICQSASAAAGRAQLTPAFQGALSVLNGTTDLARFVALFFVTFQGQYCEIGASTIAASKIINGKFGYDMPELLSKALLLIAVPYAIRYALTNIHSALLPSLTSASVGPVRVPSALRAIVSSVSGPFDFFPSFVIFAYAVLRHYSESGADIIGASKPSTLLAIGLLGAIQLRSLLADMATPAHQIKGAAPDVTAVE